MATPGFMPLDLGGTSLAPRSCVDGKQYQSVMDRTTGKHPHESNLWAFTKISNMSWICATSMTTTFVVESAEVD